MLILLVDDEPSIRLSVGDALEAEGYELVRAADGQEALDRLGEQTFDLVISDIRLPRHDGLSIFRHVRSTAPDTVVILITAYGNVDDAVGALRDGAHDYLTKPFDVDELLVKVQRVAETTRLKRALREAQTRLAERANEREIVGDSPVMARVLSRIDTIANSDLPVLITGESGTGKELVARRLHAMSPRNGGPFVAVNCAAFPESLLEAELFGHEKGAFTGAVRKRQGRFQAADGGTLFLDEIAEIPALAQVKLLRVLQESRVEPLGSDESIGVDVRVVSATHRTLKERMQQGLFREDLYYRINVLDVAMPPLRERRSDLPLLVQHFLGRIANSAPPSIEPRAWAALQEYAFPGNVRELEHAIQHAAVLSGGGPIDLEHLPRDIVGDVIADQGEDEESTQTLAEAAARFERQFLLRTLSRTEGKRKQAAALLGISRKNLWEKLKAHGIKDGDF